MNYVSHLEHNMSMLHGTESLTTVQLTPDEM